MARSEPHPGAPGGRRTQRRSSLRSQSACRPMGSPIAAPTRVPLSPPVAGTHGSPVQRARKLVRLTGGSTFDLRPRPRPPPLTLPSSQITCRCQRPLRRIRLNWPSQSEGSWVAPGVRASTFVKGALTEAWSRPALRLRTGAVAPGGASLGHESRLSPSHPTQADAAPFPPGATWAIPCNWAARERFGREAAIFTCLFAACPASARVLIVPLGDIRCPGHLSSVGLPRGGAQAGPCGCPGQSDRRVRALHYGDGHSVICVGLART